MRCPAELATVIAEILSTGLLRARAAGCSGDAPRCAVEADHLHNLPALLVNYRPELLDYYWRVERTAFMRQSTPEECAGFEPLWKALMVSIQPVPPLAPAARGLADVIDEIREGQQARGFQGRDAQEIEAERRREVAEYEQRMNAIQSQFDSGSATKSG